MLKFKTFMNIHYGESNANNASESRIPTVIMRAQPEFDILTKTTIVRIAALNLLLLPIIIVINETKMTSEICSV